MRLGRLLEIKNPYSREIDETIKPEYMVQILQQQYTTQIPVCDFVETTIVDKYCRCDNRNYKAYETIDDMLNDKLDTGRPGWESRIKNTNIPWENLNKFGYEKGIVVWYQKTYEENDIRNKYILYPLGNVYQRDIIEKWIVDMNSKMFMDSFIWKETKFWRLDVYSEKTVIYNQNLFENEYIPILCRVWEIILECRRILADSNDQNRTSNIEKYLEKIESEPGNPFYNENKVKKRKKEIDNYNPISSNI